MSISRECRVSHCDRMNSNGTKYCKKHTEHARNGLDPEKIRLASKMVKHGMVGSPTYYSWKRMKERCTPGYHESCYYFDKGISVCQEWQESFTKFLEDMGERPDGTSLDRIDPEKGYSKDNCRWASYRLQSINRGMMSNNHSGYKGVSWKKDRFQWYAHISIMGKKYNLGYHDNFWDAVRARNEAEEKYQKPIMEQA